MSSFEHDGITFHYRSVGSGQPLIFQHGLGADLEQPFSLLTASAAVRLIAFDARAHGQTRPVGPPEKICLRQFADDLGALLDHLEIPSAIVGGISMGAALTLNFALRFPHRVTGLIQSRPAWLDAPNPWNVRMFGLISRLLRERGRLEAKQAFLQTAEYREAAERWPDVAASLAGQFDNPEVDASAFKFERIIADAPCRDRQEWERIRVPTLVLANDRDPIHPLEYGRELARGIRGAEFREITAKAVSLPEHNADVQREVAAFLRRHFSLG